MSLDRQCHLAGRRTVVDPLQTSLLLGASLLFPLGAHGRSSGSACRVRPTWPYSMKGTTTMGVHGRRAAPSHLVPIMSDRGFLHLPAIPSKYGGEVRVYESSNAEYAALWLYVASPVDLNNREGPMQDAVAHLAIEEAAKLRDQNHYQVKAR